MRTKLLSILFILLLFSCGAKHSKSLEFSQPTEIILDSDADGVVDFQEVELNTPEVSESFEMDIVTSSAPTEPVKSVIRDYTIIREEEQVSAVLSNIIVPKYEMGRLIYDIPNEMLKLETYIVKARISRNTVDLSIYQGMEIIVVDTIIRTSETMQVELIDPAGDNFKIVSQSARQFIDINESTEWVFFVTPLKYGSAKLSMVVSIIKDGNLKQTVYNDDIIIKTTTWLEIKVWFGMYWQWFTVVLLIPLIKFLQNKFSKKEK